MKRRGKEKEKKKKKQHDNDFKKELETDLIFFMGVFF